VRVKDTIEEDVLEICGNCNNFVPEDPTGSIYGKCTISEEILSQSSGCMDFEADPIKPN